MKNNNFYCSLKDICCKHGSSVIIFEKKYYLLLSLPTNLEDQKNTFHFLLDGEKSVTAFCRKQKSLSDENPFRTILQFRRINLISLILVLYSLSCKIFLGKQENL